MVIDRPGRVDVGRDFGCFQGLGAVGAPGLAGCQIRIVAAVDFQGILIAGIAAAVVVHGVGHNRGVIPDPADKPGRDRPVTVAQLGILQIPAEVLDMREGE